MRTPTKLAFIIDEHNWDNRKCWSKWFKTKKLFIICMLLCYSVMSSENSEEFVSQASIFLKIFFWFFCCCFCKHCPKKQLKQAPYQNFHFLSNCFSSGVKSKKLKGVWTTCNIDTNFNLAVLVWLHSYADFLLGWYFKCIFMYKYILKI